MIKQHVHDFPTSLGNQKRRKIWRSKLLSSIDTCTFLLLLDIWKEFFILGAVMFKLSVCWVPGELRPLLGRQRVYVSWMYLWKLRLVNSSFLSAVFLRDRFFPQKSINHIFFTTARKCVKIYYEVFKRTSWKSNLEISREKKLTGIQQLHFL